MRVCFDVARFNHQPFVIGRNDELLKQALPHPFASPATEAPLGVLPVAVGRRQIAPRRARAWYPEHSVEQWSIVVGDATPDAFASQKVRLEQPPCPIIDVVPSVCFADLLAHKDRDALFDYLVTTLYRACDG